jgi:branched-chain amino acid transport system permease protein
MVVVVSIVLMVGLTLFIHRTRTGKAMRAVAFHRDAASLMGIPVDRIITITFALGSALAAAAGFLVGLTNPKIEPLMGIMPGIKAFVAAVLGGIGSIPGAMIGGLLMGISEYMVVGYLSSTYRDAIAFVILIIVLLIKPAGLLGRNVAEKV